MEDIEKDMKPKLIGETWRKYPTEKSSQLVTYGLFECQYCGKEWECVVQSIKTGNTISCGCQKSLYFKNKSTHGLSKNIFYAKWISIKDRCYNPNFIKYKDYGGRGITVCEEWLDVGNFVAWCEQTYIEGMSLDRINNDEGYSPENCRWATKTEQNINQRVRSTNTSGYVGVCFDKYHNKWVSQISFNCKNVRLGRFLTKEEAVQARDSYIIENNLPHKLSIDCK